MYNPSQLPSGDATRLCPYDKTHLILAKSFNSHLIKCRQNHKGHKMVPCNFDKTHMIPKPELAHHHNECPSRYLLDREMQKLAGDDNALMGNVKGPEIVSYSVDEDDWDAEASPAHTGRGLFNRRYEKEDDYTPDYHSGSGHGNGLRDKGDGQYDEESFRRLPHAPSAAAQMTGPGGHGGLHSSLPLPPGVKVSPVYQNPVYEYSVKQAMASSGVGRGRAGKPARPEAASQPIAGRGSSPSPSKQVKGRGRAPAAKKLNAQSNQSVTVNPTVISPPASVTSELSELREDTDGQFADAMQNLSIFSNQMTSSPRKDQLSTGSAAAGQSGVTVQEQQQQQQLVTVGQSSILQQQRLQQQQLDQQQQQQLITTLLQQHQQLQQQQQQQGQQQQQQLLEQKQRTEELISQFLQNQSLQAAQPQQTQPDSSYNMLLSQLRQNLQQNYSQLQNSQLVQEFPDILTPSNLQNPTFTSQVPAFTQPGAYSGINQGTTASFSQTGPPDFSPAGNADFNQPTSYAEFSQAATQGLNQGGSAGFNQYQNSYAGLSGYSQPVASQSPLPFNQPSSLFNTQLPSGSLNYQPSQLTESTAPANQPLGVTPSSLGGQPTSPEMTKGRGRGIIIKKSSPKKSSPGIPGQRHDVSSSSSSATLLEEEDAVGNQSHLRIPNSASQAQELQARIQSLSPTKAVINPREDLNPAPSVKVHNWLSQQTTPPEGSPVKCDLSQMSEVELKKHKRRLEKKLKQIGILEQKVSQGERITEEEEAKLNKKSDVVADLMKVLALL